MDNMATQITMTLCMFGLSATGYIFGKVTTKEIYKKSIERIEEILQDPIISRRFQEINKSNKLNKLNNIRYDRVKTR